jgi:hypothetical protein
MASYLVIFSYLQLLAFFLSSYNAVVILKFSSLFTKRNFPISRSTCGSYSVGTRQRCKIPMMYGRYLSRETSSFKLDYMRNNVIYDGCSSVGSKILDGAWTLKRSGKCLSLLNEVQPEKPVNRSATFKEKLTNMRGREIAEAIFVSGESTCTSLRDDRLQDYHTNESTARFSYYLKLIRSFFSKQNFAELEEEMIITAAIFSLLPNAWSSFPRMLVYVIECCKLLNTFDFI